MPLSRKSLWTRSSLLGAGETVNGGRPICADVVGGVMFNRRSDGKSGG